MLRSYGIWKKVKHLKKEWWKLIVLSLNTHRDTSLGGILSICTFYSVFNTPSLHNLHISAQMFDKTFGKLISSFFIACLKTNWHLLVKALFFTIGRCLRNARCCRKKQTAKAGKSESWEWDEVNVKTHPRSAKDINQIFYQDDVMYLRANIKLYERWHRVKLCCYHTKQLTDDIYQNMHK